MEAEDDEVGSGGRLGELVRIWDGRAEPYDSISRRWPLFTTLAERLIDGALGARPVSFDGCVLDLAGGAGLVSERVLARFPAAEVHLTEPAPNMLAVARARLGTRLRGLHSLAAERADELALQAQAVLCSAAFHLCEDEAVVRAAAALLAPGGRFAFNLWGHSFDETASEPPSDAWRAVLAEALALHGEPAPAWSTPKPNRVRTRAGLAALARAHGLEFAECDVHADECEPVWEAEFALMGLGRWRALGVARRVVLAEVARRLPEPTRIRSASFVLQRPG